ncbi:MAG TPA: DUF4388 domain-containing protein [Fibrobacteria bacterium]|nr:DUF4388 domain-containing protein [Fibrobacteria bacterium]
MILSGELKDFSLADVLQLLLQQRKTGVLVLTDIREKAELFISMGNLTGVRVNGETPEGKVKEILVETGRVGKAEMAELEAISRDMDRPLLATLTAKGHLQDEDRKEWLQIITEDMVCELFGWANGRYEFGTGTKAQVAGQLNISTEFACMEGMRRIDEWPRLREALPDPKMVFRPTGKTFEGDPLSWDRLVLGLVDARRNTQQIGKLVPFGSFRLSECMVNLWHGGLIAPVMAASEGLEAPIQADPQSEKDRKTAMVLGIAVLFLVFATAVRLFSIWMVGAVERTGTEWRDPDDYESAISHATARDNMEVFLIDHAARKDSLPKSLEPLVEDGVLNAREVSGSGSGILFYHKTSEKAFVLK